MLVAVPITHRLRPVPLAADFVWATGKNRKDLENWGRKIYAYGFETVVVLFFGNSFTFTTFSPMKVTNMVTAGGVP